MNRAIWRCVCVAAGTLGWLAAGSPLAQAGNVTPPPLPPGSAMTRPAPGLDPVEVQRGIRAHHHAGHFKKDFTRDDSLGASASVNPNAKK